MIHLHTHTTYSFRDGYGTADQIGDRLVELGMDAVAITGHGNTFAHAPINKALAQRGIKPIFGCEFYVVRDLTVKAIDVNMHHATVIAKNAKGYSNLLELSRISWEKGFFSCPRIDWPTLAAHSQGLVVMSGCALGLPTRLLRYKDYDTAVRVVGEISRGIENFVIEIVPQPDMDVSIRHAVDLYRMSRDLELPFVITADAHFPRPEDHLAQDIVLTVGTHEQIGNKYRSLSFPAYQFICDESAIRLRARAVLPDISEDIISQGIANTHTIADACEVELPKARAFAFPNVPVGQDAGGFLLARVNEGLHKRREAGQIPCELYDDYHSRAMREHETLCKKGFADYMLAIDDVVRHARDNGDIVVCRGSAGGCLLLWLMGASETDPIKHGLSFERFYDDTRPDPPDVDLDFERARRGDTIRYVFETYGKENCSQIAALSEFKAKSALQDTAQALGLSRSEYAGLSSELDSEDSDIDKQLSSCKNVWVLEKYPQLRVFEKLIGQVRQASIHAAGMLISAEPISSVVGTVISKTGMPVAAVDKRGAADLGFLKMDFLSVNSLDVIGYAARKIRGEVAWLYSLPLDDPNVFATTQRGRLAGIFQLDGTSAARVIREIGADSFEDLVAASALCRPGPAEWVSTYRAFKQSPAKFARYLASLPSKVAEIMRPTYGVLLYQEQVMAICREVAGFSWEEVHKLRKDITGKHDFEAAWKQRFIAGCKSHSGLTDADAACLWDHIKNHGGYSFNKSHCVTYAIVGYWALYLKTYHPTAFYEACLRLDDDDLVRNRLIREFKALGGKVSLLDPQLSKADFTAAGDMHLIGGYSGLKSVGAVQAAKIEAAGPFKDWPDLLAALPQGVRAKLAGVLVSRGEELDTPALIRLAPWYPVESVMAVDLAEKTRHQASSPGALPLGRPARGDVSIAGYAVFIERGKDRTTLTLADDMQSISCQMASDPVSVHIAAGDYVLACGWWTGETLIVKKVDILRKGCPDCRYRELPSHDPNHLEETKR